VITDTILCPAWIRELVRFTPLKNLLFVYGNIYDRVSYPVSEISDGKLDWTESNLYTFFNRFLTTRGYEVIGFFDSVDGLTFTGSDMADIYKRLQKGKPIDNTGYSEEQHPSNHVSASSSTASCEDDKKPPLKTGNTDPVQVIDGIRQAMANTTIPCAFVFNLASRLVTYPSNLTEDENNFFTRMLKASLFAKVVVRPNNTLNNVIILICEKLNDLPAFLYLSNPRARSIHLPKPDTNDRTRFIERSFRAFYKKPGDPETEPTPEIIGLFSALTDGLTYYEMSSLVNLSRIEEEPLQNIKRICDRFKYGITESEWDKISPERLDSAERKIRERVKGQEVAVWAVLDTIKRAKMGLAAGSNGKSNRPRGVLFFAGPTGVGKTEMAKTLAWLLFGQEERCLRFDMSEYSAPQSDQRLLGAPPGYIGYEEGGQLTKAVRENPFSILLFDEIEKAHGSIFDKFLQILDDGRLTDGKGETVYFSECIIIFTSNLGTVSNMETGHPSMITPEMPYSKMRDTILKGIREHFNFTLGRPELLNRIGDNFVVFDFIRPPVDEEILDMLIMQLKNAAIDSKRILLDIAPEVRTTLLAEIRNDLQHGGRGIRNITDKALIDALNRVLFDQGIEKNAVVKVIELQDHGESMPMRFELIIESLQQ
jgi:DNA polymerase III delta prime subunit